MAYFIAVVGGFHCVGFSNK